MPAPITHIFLATIALQGSLSNFDKKAFIIGTSFPDIRYLKVIDRKKTHQSNITLDEIKKEKSPFKAGFLFHSFIDKKFDDFLEKNVAYQKLLVGSKFKGINGAALKIFVDNFLLDLLHNSF